MACTHLWQGAGAMLAAYRLAGLSALEGHYAGVRVCAQFGGACGRAARFFWVSADGAATASQQTPATVSKALARSPEASGGRGFR
jgi:hypothetical protein